MSSSASLETVRTATQQLQSAASPATNQDLQKAVEALDAVHAALHAGATAEAVADADEVVPPLVDALLAPTAPPGADVFAEMLCCLQAAANVAHAIIAIESQPPPSPKSSETAAAPAAGGAAGGGAASALVRALNVLVRASDSSAALWAYASQHEPMAASGGSGGGRGSPATALPRGPASYAAFIDTILHSGALLAALTLLAPEGIARS